MADQTNHFSLFLPPKGNNAGDLGKPLNDNFVILDSILWNIRTNFADNPQDNAAIPVGAFAFDKLTDNLYINGSAGVKLIGNFGASGGGIGSGIDEDQLRTIIDDEVIIALQAPLEQINTDLIEISSNTASAIQAASDAIDARDAAILASNSASGFKVDAYNWSDVAKTQAGYASGYAYTASRDAESASSSAGAAGRSADSARDYSISAAISSGNANNSEMAALQSAESAQSYETGSEKAAQAAYQYSLNALIGTKGASDYANAAFNYYTLAQSSSRSAGDYALAASIASGFAADYAGRAETSMISVAQVSGGLITASQNAAISAQSASGFASNAQLYSVSASGAAATATEQAQLVAQALASAQSSGMVATEAQIRADEDYALANAITQVGTTYKGQTTLIQTQAHSISGILGSYTVKIDNNGFVAGYGLVSEMVSGSSIPTSQFVVTADKFAVVPPNPQPGTPSIPVFLIESNSGSGTVNLNGNLITRKMYSDNWLSSDGASGSFIDLTNGTVTLGGSSNPNFKVDNKGILTANGANISGTVLISAGSSGFGNLNDVPQNIKTLTGNENIDNSAINVGGRNYVKNASLEQYVSSAFTNWTTYNNNDTATIAQISDVRAGIYGNKSAKFTMATSSGIKTNVRFGQYISVIAGNQYTLSFWAKATRAGDRGVELTLNASPYTNYGLNFTFNPGTSWSYYVVTFTCNTTDTNARLSFLLGGTSGDTFIDNIKLEDGNVDTGFTLANEDIDVYATIATWSGVTGSGKPDNYATNGAPAGTYVGSTLAEVVEGGSSRAIAGFDINGHITQVINGVNLPTSGMKTGLNLTGNYLGYYNGTSWKSYMDNLGNFKLGDGVNGPGLAWDQVNGVLAVKGTVEASKIATNALGVVSTLNIAGNAVTVPLFLKSASSVNIGNGVEIYSFNVDHSAMAYPTIINATSILTIAASVIKTGYILLSFEVMRNGTDVIGNLGNFKIPYLGFSYIEGDRCMYQVIDTSPPKQLNTYSISVNFMVYDSDGTTNSVEGLRVANASEVEETNVVILGAKR